MDIFFWSYVAAQAGGGLCLPVGNLNPVQVFESIADSQNVFAAGSIVFEQIDERADRLVWWQAEKSNQPLFKNSDLLFGENLFEFCTAEEQDGCILVNKYRCRCNIKLGI